MPRSLVSYWKRVAVSGPTVDGREILPQDLRDIAETYNPSLYTAVIWCDHDREYGSHGTVFSLRLAEEDEELEPGQIALEAQFKPNDRLLFLNDQGQKLFSSIEITPNFRGTGKAYMTGIAVTDEPASTGTQELYFTKQTSKAKHYAAFVDLGNGNDEKPQGEMGKLIGLLTNLFKRFSLDNKPAETPSTFTESKTPMDEATATALAALLEQLLIVAAGIKAVIEPAVEEAPEPDQEPIDNVSEAVDDIVATAEEEREFRRGGGGNKAVLSALAALKKQFSILQNTPVGRQLPRNTGPQNPAKKRVL